MPEKYDRCVKEIKEKIKKGNIPKTYKKNKKTKETNPYAICKKTNK